jgi:uncharacterized protein
VTEISLFRTLVSILGNRRSFANQAGVTFEGERDLYCTLGYKPELSTHDYWSRYRRNAVAARVVEAYPKSTWRGTGTVIETTDPSIETEFEQAWDELDTRLSIWPTFMKADILAGLGRFSVILLGAPGTLSSPLTRVNTQELAVLSCFSEKDVHIKTWEGSLASPRYGLPTAYTFARLDPSALGPTIRTTGDTEVHWSRVIHVADGLLDDHVYGQPRLERVWNLLDDLEKITGAGSEAFWLRAHQGYAIEVDKETRLTPDDVTKLQEETEAFVNQIQRYFRLRGAKVNVLGSDVANFDRNVDSVISQISSGTGIPQRILMGSERGQLASQQDRVNWAERVQDRRTEFAAHICVRQFVDRLISLGTLPEPQSYEPWWPQIYDLSDNEQADIGLKYTQMNQINGGIEDPDKLIWTSDEIRYRSFGAPPMPQSNRKPTKVQQAKLDKQKQPVQQPFGRPKVVNE